MTEISKERIKKFWEQCGFVHWKGSLYWYPDDTGAKRLPPVTGYEALAPLFKYAVLLAIDKIMAEQECSSDVAYAILFDKWLQELVLIIPEVATALFLVLERVLVKEEQSIL
ncbi:hypothetical protein LCGC14_1442670 [marine sediment metagenome]|uniref:Uncharacterized protein n=1 Tax=marine sediment metagenome TaxID=412755 RepID=A0A0F9JKU9_9ZZZZ